MVYRLGIVGAGRWGSTIATRLTETKTAEISVVCDVDAVRARELSDKVGARAIFDVRDLERFRDLVGVVVAVSIDKLYEVASDVISMGFNVWIEKPVSDTLEKVRRLRALAESRGVVAMPGFIVRFDPVTRALKNMIRDERFDMVLLRMGSRPEHMKRHSIALDLAIHDVDLARYLSGSEIEVREAILRKLEIDEDFIMLGRHKDGFLSIHVSGNIRNKVRKAIILTSRETIDADYISQSIQVSGTSIRISGTEPLIAEARAFIDKCTGKEVESPTLLDAEKAHEIIGKEILHQHDHSTGRRTVSLGSREG